MSLEVFDRKQTDYQGLWYHPEYHGYSSACLSLAKLKQFKGNVRMFVVKNRYYKQGGNQPNYLFRLMDSDSPIFKTMEICEAAKMDDKLYVTIGEACSIAQYQYDGKSDPADVYAPWDFGGKTIAEILGVEV